MEEDDLESLFRDKLDNLEIPVSDGVWKRISTTLSNRPNPWKFSLNAINIIVIAAVLIIGFTLGLLYNYSVDHLKKTNGEKASGVKASTVNTQSKAWEEPAASGSAAQVEAHKEIPAQKATQQQVLDHAAAQQQVLDHTAAQQQAPDRAAAQQQQTQAIQSAPAQQGSTVKSNAAAQQPAHANERTALAKGADKFKALNANEQHSETVKPTGSPANTLSAAEPPTKNDAATSNTQKADANSTGEQNTVLPILPTHLETPTVPAATADATALAIAQDQRIAGDSARVATAKNAGDSTLALPTLAAITNTKDSSAVKKDSASALATPTPANSAAKGKGGLYIFVEGGTNFVFGNGAGSSPLDQNEKVQWTGMIGVGHSIYKQFNVFVGVLANTFDGNVTFNSAKPLKPANAADSVSNYVEKDKYHSVAIPVNLEYAFKINEAYTLSPYVGVQLNYLYLVNVNYYAATTNALLFNENKSLGYLSTSALAGSKLEYCVGPQLKVYLNVNYNFLMGGLGVNFGLKRSF